MMSKKQDLMMFARELLVGFVIAGIVMKYMPTNVFNILLLVLMVVEIFSMPQIGRDNRLKKAALNEYFRTHSQLEQRDGHYLDEK